MKTNKILTIKMIVTAGIFLSFEIILQLIGNYVFSPGGFTSLNFSLIIIALGAILYGPLVGGFLGLISGIMTIFSPSTISYFYAINPVGTILTCLLKTTLSGVVAGLVIMIFKKKSQMIIGSIVVSLLIPIINTGLFAVFCLMFFMERLTEINPNNVASALFLGLIGLNFIFEILITTIITPSLLKIMHYISVNKEG